MSTRVIRSLVLAALLLPAAVLLTPARAQMGPPGGIGGMPGGPPGGMGGMPGGFQGGMAGQPGGIGGGGIGGGAMDEWVCSGCGAVIGHGSMKPAWLVCPRCGARFTDGPGDPDPGPPGFNPPPPAAQNNATTAGGNRTALIVVTIGVGTLLVLGVVGAAVYFGVNRAARKGAPRRRKRTIYQEERRLPRSDRSP
jgi:hypothetical protein